MADILLPWLLSNLLISSLVAIVAWLVQRCGRWPGIANMLWIFVLLKLLTPPLWTLELIPIDGVNVARQADVSQSHTTRKSSGTFEAEGTNIPDRDYTFNAVAEKVGSDLNALSTGIPGMGESGSATGSLSVGFRYSVSVWLASSLFLGLVAAVRVIRFRKELNAYGHRPDDTVLRLVRELASELGLGYHPKVTLSRARVSPFCWWFGGSPEIVISANAAEDLDLEELRMVLGHEMAHLKRRDHWVRWLEFLVSITFWWNPLVYWFRRQLRITEELACDAMVLEKIDSTGLVYASSLVRMAELLAATDIHPPAMASAMTSGGNLEKRLKMIISKKGTKSPPWNSGWVLLLAVAVFPLGLVYGQDVEAVKRRLGQSVEAGEITKAQAGFMLEALKLSMKMKSFSESDSYTDPDKREMEEKKEKYREIALDLKRAVERGKISAEEAEEEMIAIRREIFGGPDDEDEDQDDDEEDDDEEEEEEDDDNEREQMERELAERKERFGQYLREIEMAVKKGKLSKSDAKEKLNAAREKMFGDLREDDEEERESEDRVLAEREARFSQAYKEIEKAVRQGRLSKEEAQERLRGIKREWESANADREMAERREKFEAIANEVEEQVRRGKLSKEDARRKLSEIRRDLFGDQEQRDPRNWKAEKSDRDRGRIREILKRRFAEAAEEIEAMVEKGKMSRKDAQRKIQAIERELLGDRDEHESQRENRKAEDQELRKRQFDSAVREIKSAVKNEEISPQEAEEKIQRMHRKLFDK